MKQIMIPDFDLEPKCDIRAVGYDFQNDEVYVGQCVWVDRDGNYIDEESVTPYFKKYLEFTGAKLVEILE